MPRTSVRAKAIKLLSKYASLEEEYYGNLIMRLKDILHDDEDDDIIDLFEVILRFSAAKTLLQDIESKRYFASRLRHLPKASTVEEKLHFLEILDDGGFLEEYRMSQDSFEKLINLIRDHPEYNTGSRKKQIDIRIQVAVALEKLGNDGNGVSVSKVARKYGIGTGTVYDILKRFFKAVLSLEQQFVYWPNAAEKSRIVKENEAAFGFPDCVGFIDGCTFPLAYAPIWRRRDFFSGHKSYYCVNTVAVCDDERRFRYFGCGWVGCANDMRVLPESNFGKHPERYFTGDEYVLADPGYTSQTHLLAVKKKPKNRDMPPDDEKFNQYIAMMRIKIEHAFGILKGRFQSLRKIPIEIRNVDDLWFVNAWIRTCVVLHNFLLDQHDDEATIIMKELWDQVERLDLEDIQNGGMVVDEDPDDDADGPMFTQRSRSVGRQRYEQLKVYILTKNGYGHLLQRQ